jgi:hypothetical protein
VLGVGTHESDCTYSVFTTCAQAYKTAVKCSVFSLVLWYDYVRATSYQPRYGRWSRLVDTVGSLHGFSLAPLERERGDSHPSPALALLSLSPY